MKGGDTEESGTSQEFLKKSCEFCCPSVGRAGLPCPLSLYHFSCYLSRGQLSSSKTQPGPPTADFSYPLPLLSQPGFFLLLWNNDGDVFVSGSELLKPLEFPK